LVFDPNQWAAFMVSEGIDLEPGASHTVELSGHTRRADSESVGLTGHVFDHTGMGIAEFSQTAAVTRTYGSVSGIVFADRNGNATFDAGEQLPGAAIAWQYAYYSEPEAPFRTTADANGRFSFPSIPATRYQMANAELDGWTVLSRTIDVDQSDKNVNLRMRAVKPVRRELAAELKFTKDSYAPGDLAHVTVTLSNSGAIPLTGIAAHCNGNGDHHALWGFGPGWGQLSPRSSGVTVPAGQTRTFDVTDVVPDAAFDKGYVAVRCEFGYVGDENTLDMPLAQDDALVPGGIGVIKGEIAYYPEGEGSGKPRQPIAGARVVLVNERPCHVAEQLTDNDGRFEFVNLPAGPGNYSLYFYPPAGWRATGRNPATHLKVADGDTIVIGVDAVRGVGQLPPLPAEAAGCRPGTTTSSKPPAGNPPATDPPVSPAPQARPAGPDLANTGPEDVPMLAALGVLAVLLGSGLMLATRRRGTGDNKP
jgi:LPXTG-motif cell wall-anchored protein